MKGLKIAYMDFDILRSGERRKNKRISDVRCPGITFYWRSAI